MRYAVRALISQSCWQPDTPRWKALKWSPFRAWQNLIRRNNSPLKLHASYPKDNDDGRELLSCAMVTTQPTSLPTTALAACRAAARRANRGSKPLSRSTSFLGPPAKAMYPSIMGPTWRPRRCNMLRSSAPGLPNHLGRLVDRGAPNTNLHLRISCGQSVHQYPGPAEN